MFAPSSATAVHVDHVNPSPSLACQIEQSATHCLVTSFGKLLVNLTNVANKYSSRIVIWCKTECILCKGVRNLIFKFVLKLVEK